MEDHSERLDTMVVLRLSHSEKRRAQRLAMKMKLSLSELARQAIAAFDCKRQHARKKPNE